MLVNVLTRLASFSARKPKTVALTVAGIIALSLFAQHKLVLSERDKLRIAEAGYKKAVTAFELREADLQEDIAIAEAYATAAIKDRAASRAALDAFRRDRTDEESITWAAQAIPLAELRRLCEALPEMDGCQNIPPMN